jgi:hypothetical protein
MKLTDKDLLAIIKSHRRDSLGVKDGDLSSQRAAALDHYYGRPYGNEQEGRSQVVSRDLAEAVDWALPGIVRVFASSGALGEFDAVGPEDEEQAQQETDYTNQVIMKDNAGFVILHDVVKDTLLLKNGYVKHYWHVDEKIEEEEYSGLSIDALAKLDADLKAEGAEIEIKEHEERMIDIGGQLMPVFDVRLKITRKKGRVCIEAVPPEEVRVSKRCRGSLQDSPFVEHVTHKTRSDLIEMGMPREFVKDLPAYSERENSEESYSRDSLDDETDDFGASSADRSMDDIEYCEAYLRVDWDGDGVAELRKVVTVADKIPPGKYWNEPIEAVPMTGFVAKRMPHRHVGESLDDELSDLQEIKTVLMRQMLDNIYLTNTNQWLVNERVNISDFLQSMPGGIKRVQGMEPVSGSAEAVNTTPIVGHILPVVDYIDNLKESRTGISKASTGLDPDILKQSTKGAFLENLNRASQKIEMITRLLAETGVKEMFLQTHSLLVRHQDRSRVVKMRGKYVEVNPQEWRDRTDLTARVGLGTGNEEEKREKLMLVATLAEKIAAMGLVGPDQAYNLFSDLVKTMGFDMPEKYAMDPAGDEFAKAQQGKKPPVNPLAEVEQIKGQVAIQRETMKLQHDASVEQTKQSKDFLLQFLEMRVSQVEQAAERRSREAIEAAKLEMQAFLSSMRVDLGQPGMGAGLQEPSPAMVPNNQMMPHNQMGPQ